MSFETLYHTLNHLQYNRYSIANFIDISSIHIQYIYILVHGIVSTSTRLYNNNKTNNQSSHIAH